MNKDLITKVLQEIKAENPNFFLPPHFHVLSWKSQKIEGALITKINGQRYIGFLRKDKNGQEYWKYKPLTESSSSANSSASESPVMDSLKKQEIPYGKNNSEE